MASPSIQQTVTGDHNIFTATGDINVTYTLPPAEAADHHDLTILLDRVEAFWIEGVLERSVLGDMSHALVKDDATETIQHPWESVLEQPGSDPRLISRDESIKSIFDKVGRSLLILGEPGSGKTVTLLELARDLVRAARTDPRQPVPVVLNLSSWRGQPLLEWLVGELKIKYFVAERMARPLLAKNRLALLLDGLDEVSADCQAGCIEAINAFNESCGVPGFAVCSRVGEYSALPTRLRLHGAVRLEALTREQVDRYLAAMGEELAGLRSALAEDDALDALSRSPLMLRVMSVAYRGKTVPSLGAGDPSSTDARRGHIFDSYVDQMFARKGGEAAGERGMSESWLASLAHRMRGHSESVFTFEGLQPSWLHRRRDRLGYALRSRMTVGLVLGITEGAYLAPLGIMGNPPAVDFVLGVLLGLSFGLGAALYDGWRIERSAGATGKTRKAGIASFVACLAVYYLLFAVPFTLLFQEHAAQRLPFGFVWALLLALRVRVPAARSDIRPVEAIAWEWPRAFKGAAIGAGLGLLFSVGIYVGYRHLFTGDDLRPWAYPVLLPIAYTTLGLLFGGLATATSDARAAPGQGIRQSLKSACLVGALIAGVSGAGTVLYLLGPPLFFDDPLPSVLETVIFCALVGIYFGLVAALAFGGIDVIYHLALRRSLARADALPRALGPFLERMSALALVQRVGGGYIFLHRLLLEHFADRYPGAEPQPA